MKGRRIRRVVLSLFTLVIVAVTTSAPNAYGYYNRGTVQLSLGGSSATLNVGETTTISATMSPESYSGVIGCGQAICPQQCDGKCGDEVTGSCACAGPDRKTEEARASVSVADPFIASASYSNGTITIKGKKAGSTTVTVTGKLWQHTDSSSETISVTVEDPNANAGDGSGGDPGNSGNPGNSGDPGNSGNPAAPSPVTNQPSPVTNNPPVVHSPVPVATPYVPIANPSYAPPSEAPVPVYSAQPQDYSAPSPVPANGSGSAPYVPGYSASPTQAAPNSAASPAKAQPTPYRPTYVQNVPQPSSSAALPLPSADIVAAPPAAGGTTASGRSGSAGGSGSTGGGNPASRNGGSFASPGGGSTSAGVSTPKQVGDSGGKPYVSAAKPYVAVIAPYVPLVAAQGTDISEEEQREVISKMQALAPVAPQPLAGEGEREPQPLASPDSSEPETEQVKTQSMETMRGAMRMITLTDTTQPAGKADMEQAKEKKERLTFQKLDESNNVLYSWTFEGETIGTPEDISFDISFPQTAPVLKKAVSSLVKPFYVSFAHDGDLPGPAEIYINTGSKFAEGDNLTLYLLDTEKGRLVPAATNLSASAGYVSFTISHNSDYVLAVGSPSYSSGSAVIIVAVAVLLIIAAGTVVLVLSGMKRRRQLKDAA